jgi:peptide/nickel transport system permease protein
MQRLPATVQLAIAALCIGILVAFPAGIISALRPGTSTDVATSVVSQIGVTIPDFWLGILLVLLFSLTLQWLPPSGYSSIREDPASWLSHIILPAATAGIISAAIMTRFIRSAMLEVLGQDYVRTGRAKGLRERAVVVRHALRPALLSSVVVVEVVFAWPGLGRLALNAVLDRDYPLLQGAVLTMAAMLTFVNLGTDLLYFWLDPRIEYT